MTFELKKIHHKSLNVDLDHELALITSIVRCWVNTGRDYAHEQVQESLKRILNWLEVIPDSSRSKIAKGMLCLVKVVNSILICLEQGGQETILSVLGGLFINHMHFVIDMTRPFCSKRPMESEITLLEEKSKIELPTSYTDLTEHLRTARGINLSLAVDNIEFKLILEPTLTHPNSFMQKKWKKADMVLDDKKLKILVRDNAFLQFFRRVIFYLTIKKSAKSLILSVNHASISPSSVPAFPNCIQLSLVNGSILFLNFCSKEVLELWKLKLLKASE